MLAAGGTIAMAGSGRGGAAPAHGADALIAAVPSLGSSPDLRARTLDTRPSVQLDAAAALEIAREAALEADGGRGVVVTHGTDTLEEVALLCDLLYAGDAPIVFTGAMRPASGRRRRPREPARRGRGGGVRRRRGGLGVLVAFAGRVHAARAVRKADSTAPDAFASPRLGPVGRVQEGRARISRRLERRPPIPVAALDATVHVVAAGLGTDAALVEAAVEAGADGLVGVVLGAGHTPPPFLAALRRAAGRIPVVATVRPERGAILHGTYASRAPRGTCGRPDHLRRRTLPRGGADQADGLPRRGLHARRDGRRLRDRRLIATRRPPRRRRAAPRRTRAAAANGSGTARRRAQATPATNSAVEPQKSHGNRVVRSLVPSGETYRHSMPPGGHTVRSALSEERSTGGASGHSASGSSPAASSVSHTMTAATAHPQATTRRAMAAG